MKKAVKLLFAMCMLVFAMTACGSSQPAPQATPEPTPTPTPEMVIDEQVAEDVNIELTAALDHIVDGQELTTNEKISNAIINATSYEIVFADENKCKIKVKYPDAAALVQQVSADVEELTQENLEAMLQNILVAMEDGNFETVEQIFETQVKKSEDDVYGIVWTDEMTNAFTGGLYNMGQEE